MNGIKSSKKERTSSNETADHQLSEKEQSNEQEKKNKDLENPAGFSTMSPLQKFFFVLSLLLSVLYVVAFAWLIPCKIPDSNDTKEPIIVTEKWKLNFSEIGISTSLTLTKELSNGSLLLFGYKHMEDNELGGLISINGDEGRLLWQTKLNFIPRFISCDSLDINFDDTKECIIIGDNGSVALLNQTSGEVIWMKQNFLDPAYGVASIPIVIPSCDSDGIFDLVVAYSEFSSLDERFPDSVSIEILSGHNGNRIGVRKSVAECISIVNKLQLWKRDELTFDVLFYCNDNDGFGNLWKIPVNELCKVVHESTSQINFTKIYRIDQAKYNFFNVLYQPAHKLYSSGENMLVAWKGGNIILLDAESDLPSWNYNSNTSAEIRALFTGQFTNDSDYQVAMINSDEESGSMITVLQIETGNKVMSTLYPKYFLTEAIPLRNILFGTDGILVKHIKMQSKVTVENTFMQNSSSNSVNRQPLDKYIIREEYLISRPGCTDNESLKFVTSDKVTKLLQQNSTYQNRIESNHVTVAVRNLNVEDSLELFIASTLSISTEKNDASPGKNINEITTVKLLHLSHTLFSKNNTCECSC